MPHYDQLYRFIDAAISHVQSEQEVSDMKDSIDVAVCEEIQKSQFKTCPQCKLLTEKSKGKCPQCGTSLMKNVIADADGREPPSTQSVPSEKKMKFQHFTPSSMTAPSTNELGVQEIQYNHIPSNHTQARTVKLLDSVFVNPNSLGTISRVVRHIGKKAEVKRYGVKKSKLVIVVCDGLPYGQILTLKQDALVCGECNTKVMGFDALKQQAKSIHNKATGQVPYFEEFDWVLLKCGDEHVEINLMKSFMNLNWLLS